ncbi:MAG: hypothetical protein JST68_19735 [Bacteroidetes bacterium]|nr:hypothetical protein [Bacteroidota bacterium]
MSLRKKILFIIGSPNQASQMHQIASLLPEYDCFFSQLYSKHPVVRLALRMGLLDTTILGGEFKRKGDAYLEKHRLRNDYARSIYGNSYDLVVLCSDLLVTQELRSMKTIWVQEGMTDPITPWGKFTHSLGLPGYFAKNTAFNGCSDICDIYCSASDGYREQFSQRGTDESKILVTGIPNYDNAATFLKNDFPHRDYVMVATSDIRECFNKEDRPAFVRRCVEIAGSRQLIFKLHPNEKKERAIAEIREGASNALIYTEGNTEHMIANCTELITQYSTVVYIGIALGKKVHSFFDVEQLKRLAPIQNGGTSAAVIAGLCRRYVEFKGKKEDFLRIMRTAANTIMRLHERSDNHYHYSDQEGVFPSA